MGQIIEFPEVAKLKRKIQKLKNSLEDLVLERDELRFVICKNIKTSYMLEIGNLEYRVYEAYCEYLRLRRKKELIQAKKNRQETIKMEEIENLLDEEFRSYKKKLEEKINEINQALERSKLEKLSPNEVVEIKKLYRSIVKSLHPDLNPTNSKAEKQLFVNATEAYKKGDLKTLRIISQMLGADVSDEEESSSLIKLKKDIERVQSLVAQLKEEIEQIKTKPPYIWRIYLEDENKKTKKIAELNKELKSFQEAIRTQEEHIYNLIRS